MQGWTGTVGTQVTASSFTAPPAAVDPGSGDDPELAAEPPPRPEVYLPPLLPAGAEGSPVPRALVRSVAGPLPLAEPPPGQSVSQLRALRWPEGAQPQRLQARAWIEAPTGQVLLMAADRCP